MGHSSVLGMALVMGFLMTDAVMGNVDAAGVKPSSSVKADVLAALHLIKDEASKALNDVNNDPALSPATRRAVEEAMNKVSDQCEIIRGLVGTSAQSRARRDPRVALDIIDDIIDIIRDILGEDDEAEEEVERDANPDLDPATRDGVEDKAEIIDDLAWDLIRLV